MHSRMLSQREVAATTQKTDIFLISTVRIAISQLLVVPPWEKMLLVVIFCTLLLHKNGIELLYHMILCTFSFVRL